MGDTERAAQQVAATAAAAALNYDDMMIVDKNESIHR